MTSEFDRRLLNDFQHEFPLTPTPYADMARALGVSEDEVIARLRELKQSGAVATNHRFNRCSRS